MARFSERIGIKPIKNVLQVESIDDDLKNRLWSAILEDFFNRINDASYQGRETEKGVICKLIWKEFYKKPVDSIPQSAMTGRVDIHGCIGHIRSWFYRCQWYDIYDFIEFLAMLEFKTRKTGFTEQCNLILEQEVAGYRIVNETVVQITSEAEVQTIEEALLATEKMIPVNSHLKTSLDLLADRQSPDYRNSIKESISAVEALCTIITGDRKATLGKALAEIEKNNGLHSALKTAFSAIYGYASDSGGIRHALLEGDTTVAFEEAKFMLVSCSAFINYLRAKIKI